MAKSHSFLTATEVSQTEQTEVHGKFSETAPKVGKEYIGKGKISHLYGLLKILHYPVPPAKSLVLRQKTDFVVFTKQYTTWGEGIREHNKAGHYTKCATLSVSVNEHRGHMRYSF